MMNAQSQDDSQTNVHSPPSLMGSSVQSHQVSSFEIEEASSAGVTSRKINQDWRLGMPWFIGTARSTSPRDAEGSESPRYYGGLMKAEETLIPNIKGKRDQRKSRRNARRIGRAGFADGNISSVSMDEESSIGDFSKSEWTPEDSAYGAACPVCGCIPKHVRRTVEFSMIGIMVLAFVWMVITASIHVTNAHRNAAVSNSTSTDTYNGQMIAVDDDFYVEVTNDDVNVYDDDVSKNAGADDAYVADDQYMVDDTYSDDAYMDDASSQYSNGFTDDGERWRILRP
jgi:hypothetical protein